MIRDNYNNKSSSQPFHENQFQFPADTSNQMQPRGNLPAEFQANPVNFVGNNHNAPYLIQHKNAEATAGQQRLHFSLGTQVYNDRSDQQNVSSIYNQNPVSTGLRLSYDDDERNSSITSGSGSIASSVFSSLGYDIRREIDLQKEELDQFIKSQEENMVRGVRSLKQQHMASLVKALEKVAAKKLHEKDLELASITRKNQELAENMKLVAAQAQTWCNWAKYNESVIDTLKNNIRQAIEDSNNQAKEGTGESDFDAASCIDPNNHLGNSSAGKNDMLCRSCRAKEVSILLMPCRHLCLCKDCGEGSVSACPVCQMITSGRFEVYLS